MRAKWVAMAIVLAACGGNGASTTTEPGGSATSAATQTTTTAAATTTTMNTGPVDIVAVTPLPLVMADFDNNPAPDLGVTMALVTSSPLKAVFSATNGFPGDCLGFTLWVPDFTMQFVNGYVDLTPGGCGDAQHIFTGDQILLQTDETIAVELGEVPDGMFIPQFQLVDIGFQSGFYSRPLEEPLDPGDIHALGTGLFTFFGGGTFSGTDGVWESYPLPEAATGSCVPQGSTICLNNDRFKVDGSFKTGSSMTAGSNPATPLSSQGDTGLFYFLDERNWEIIIKVLNGCSINNRFWVFASSATDVEFTVTIEDTVTGQVRMYENPQSGPFQPVADTEAFNTCP